MKLFKKGEKELQMIFGLFILLIISLVVLSLFFKFTEKSSGKLEGASTEYFTKAEIEQAIQECTILCEQITNPNTIIEFCKKIQSVDWNGDKTLGGRIRYGTWEFCEETIPCFILVDNCQGGKYTATKCKEVLEDPAYNSVDVLQKLVDAPADGSCDLTANDVVAPVPNTNFGLPTARTGAQLTASIGPFCNVDSNANWRCKFGLYNALP